MRTLLGPSSQLHDFVRKACFSNAVKGPLGLWLSLCVGREGRGLDCGGLLREHSMDRGLKEMTRARAGGGPDLIQAGKGVSMGRLRAGRSRVQGSSRHSVVGSQGRFCLACVRPVWELICSGLLLLSLLEIFAFGGHLSCPRNHCFCLM